jgi:L-iditol 2-dehydrogenase
VCCPHNDEETARAPPPGAPHAIGAGTPGTPGVGYPARPVPAPSAPPSVPATMQAAVYRGKDDVRMESIPVPGLEPGEVLVKVAACGVCGTDLKKVQQGVLPPPRVFGHETAGTIVRMAADVRDWKIGDRVAVYHHIPDRTSWYSQRGLYAQCPRYKQTGVTAGFTPAGGGFSEYVRVMPWIVEGGGLVRVPEDVSWEEAVFVEPVNTCLKGVRMLDLDE